MRKIAGWSVLALLCSGQTSAHHGGKGLPLSLFSSQSILDSRKDIALSDDQAKSVEDLRKQLNDGLQGMNAEIGPASEALLTLLASAKVDEQRALPTIDKILALEQQRKKLELVHLIRLKNILNESQQNLLTTSRRKKGR